MSNLTSSKLIVNNPPSDAYITKICNILTEQSEKEKCESKYAGVKQVLTLLGKGAVLTAALLTPKSATILLPLVKESSDWDVWKQFNPSYLQRTLKRLERQKEVEVAEENGQQIIRLTRNGKRKILKYSLDSVTIGKPKRWDGKWRLVLYDIPSGSRKISELIRETLKRLGFYQIQESVYILPYPCFNQIEFLRQYYGLGNKVQYMIVEDIENDSAFKTYFGL